MTWHNSDTANHQVVANDGSFASPVLKSTESYSGAFSFGVSPTIQTSYQAHWHTTNSNSVTVNVAPRVGFGLSGRLYTAKVTSDLTYGGRFVWVQRRNLVGGWHNVKQVYLGDSSRAVFRLRLPHGRSVLRLFLPSGQAGAGYVQGLSRLLAVKR